MPSTKPILVHEFQTIRVGDKYPLEKDGKRVFEQHHFDALAKYFTQNKPPFYSLGYNRIYFNQYVGVIKVGDLTIEVLPKTDRHELAKAEWQKVLLEMLLISLQVEAKTTTQANITIRQHSVLDTYLQLFVDEAERLIHQGLVKKYRTNVSNQTALKGKLLVHKQITHNAVHAERFYVAHQVYDRDNVYNAILRAALECVANEGSLGVSRDAQALLLFFPECKPVVINEKLFAKLCYDRKTEGYRRAIELARIILLNYHPDLKGGQNDILAIMFDMNHLWESFITWSLKRHAPQGVRVLSQRTKPFWRPDGGHNRTLQPDLLIEKDGQTIVVDTKWKYQSTVSLEDLRQVYAYLHYFKGHAGYLLYPDKLDEETILVKTGKYQPVESIASNMHCGLMFADLILPSDSNNVSRLNRKIGQSILSLDLLTHA